MSEAFISVAIGPIMAKAKAVQLTWTDVSIKLTPEATETVVEAGEWVIVKERCGRINMYDRAGIGIVIDPYEEVRP